jgi:protein-tyrosine-phosphatase
LINSAAVSHSHSSGEGSESTFSKAEWVTPEHDRKPDEEVMLSRADAVIAIREAAAALRIDPQVTVDVQFRNVTESKEREEEGRREVRRETEERIREEKLKRVMNKEPPVIVTNEDERASAGRF